MNTVIKFLRGLMPQAVITQHIKDAYEEYECDLRHANITPEQHDDLFPPLKEHFKERLMERHSYCTGHFTVYLKKEVNPKSN